MMPISPAAKLVWRACSYKRRRTSRGRPEQGLQFRSRICAVRRAAGSGAGASLPAVARRTRSSRRARGRAGACCRARGPTRCPARKPRTVVDHVDDDRWRGPQSSDAESVRTVTCAGAGVLEHVGQRFLQDAQHLQDLVRTEVGQRRQVGDLPQESQPPAARGARCARGSWTAPPAGRPRSDRSSR